MKTKEVGIKRQKLSCENAPETSTSLQLPNLSSSNQNSLLDDILGTGDSLSECDVDSETATASALSLDDPMLDLDTATLDDAMQAGIKRVNSIPESAPKEKGQPASKTSIERKDRAAVKRRTTSLPHPSNNSILNEDDYIDILAYSSGDEYTNNGNSKKSDYRLREPSGVYRYQRRTERTYIKRKVLHDKWPSHENTYLAPFELPAGWNHHFLFNIDKDWEEYLAE